jgi:3-deoxy-D-manno-octulosonic-acid transferase
MYFLYSALLALALVGGSPYWLYQAARHGKYRKGLSERLGRVPARFRGDRRQAIWVHAVSVGEVLAVSELAHELRREFRNYRVVISTTTDTGQRLAAVRFGAENVFYFPFDFAFAVRRWRAALRPKLIVVAETEFWPNLLRLGESNGAQIVIVNARISDRSFPGYRRWRRLLTRVLQNVDLFLAQTDEDARRLRQIGADEYKVLVGGNLKYDIPAPTEAPVVAHLRAAQKDAGPVLVCGSTVEREEEILLNAFRQVLMAYPQAIMLLAPRHPERFSDVAALLTHSGLKWQRRSSWQVEPLTGGVLLLDSIGELASLYALADLAFVGGSLVPRGGHNILEPAQHGAPILVGEHTENFHDIIELFKGYDAVEIVNADNFGQRTLELLADDARRRDLGRRAKEALRSHQGATAFTLTKIREMLAGAHEVTPA